MAESLISIVIPVHNKAALTRQCLDSIFEARPDAPFEVLVVDDASHDSTPSMLEAYGEDVTTVHSGAQLRLRDRLQLGCRSRPR